MKISFYFILLFIPFRAFSQDAELVASRDKNDTVKRVFVNGKVGLVHTDGRQILEPEYTDVRMEEQGIRLYNKNLQGYLPKGSKEIIPVNYKNITPNNEYFEAENEGGMIDLYFGSKLLASDLDSGLQLMDILFATNCVIIRKEEKAGIMDRKGTLIVPLEYSAIEAKTSFQYNLNDSVITDYILVLDKSEYFYSPESEGFLLYGEPVLYLAKADGILITDSVFSEVFYNPELDEFSLRCNNKLAFMKPDFRIDYSPYERITDFMEWKICYTGKEAIVFNRFNMAIDTFLSVIIPARDIFYTENEESVEMSSYSETIYEGFVYVTKNSGDTSFMAIYDLRNQKMVSGWEEGLTYVRKGKSVSGSTVWIYMNAWGKLAFSTLRGGSSAFEYDDIYPITNQFYAFKKEGETAHVLCELVGDSVFVERATIDKTFGSFNYTGINTPGVYEYDANLSRGFVDEFGNYYPYSTDSAATDSPILLVPFTVFKNSQGKLGLISWNGKVVDLNADSLCQRSNANTLIDYRAGNLWGAVEVAQGSNFKPDQAYSGQFRLMEGIHLIYRQEEAEKRYVDSKGRVFYSDNIERTISKKGKLKGSEVYSDYEDKQQVAIPFVYSELLPVWDNLHFIAKGPTKKWGIISAFNDTVFPFQYDKLELAGISEPNAFFPYRDYDQQCFTTKGKSHGLISLNLRKEIPAVYESVQYIPEAAFIVKKEGKFGVYDYNLTEQIKPVFDELFIAGSISGVYVLRARKGERWYNLEFFEGKVPDQTTLLQTLPCDLVINETGFVKNGDAYKSINFMEAPAIPKDADIATYLNDKRLRLKDGKIFLTDPKGKFLYQEGLTNIVVQEDQVISVENGVTYSYSLLKKQKNPFVGQ